MSYMNTLRLHFAGRFFSDPSTVNNDWNHYDNASFDRRKFWIPQDAQNDNGWWNPEGANRFRLVDVKPTASFYNDGTPVKASDDSVGSAVLTSKDGPSAAKMVDLDPDQQLVSMIFGLTVALVDGQNRVLFEGNVEPAPFTDIWKRGRGGSDIGNDERAGVFYQTVIHVSRWGDLSSSRFLQQIREQSQDQLSIRFNLDGYSMASPDAKRRLTGRIVGTMGALKPDDKRHWVAGRQLASGRYRPFGASPGFAPKANFGVAVFDAERGKLRIDLGNALTMDFSGGDALKSGVSNLGDLSLVSIASDGRETVLSRIPYGGSGWYERTAGIVEVPADRPFTDQEREALLGLPVRNCFNLSGAGGPTGGS